MTETMNRRLIIDLDACDQCENCGVQCSYYERPHAGEDAEGVVTVLEASDDLVIHDLAAQVIPFALPAGTELDAGFSVLLRDQQQNSGIPRLARDAQVADSPLVEEFLGEGLDRDGAPASDPPRCTLASGRIPRLRTGPDAENPHALSRHRERPAPHHRHANLPAPDSARPSPGCGETRAA